LLHWRRLQDRIERSFRMWGLCIWSFFQMGLLELRGQSMS
jgi:hypothetical protein